MAAVAGAGPKSMTDVNRNVSDIDACTGMPGTRSVNDPQATARMPSSSHSGTRSTAGSAVSDWAMASKPATVTKATKRDSTRIGWAATARVDRRRHGRRTGSPHLRQSACRNRTLVVMNSCDGSLQVC